MERHEDLVTAACDAAKAFYDEIHGFCEGDNLEDIIAQREWLNDPTSAALYHVYCAQQDLLIQAFNQLTQPNANDLQLMFDIIEAEYLFRCITPITIISKVLTDNCDPNCDKDKQAALYMLGGNCETCHKPHFFATKKSRTWIYKPLSVQASDTRSPQ